MSNEREMLEFAAKACGINAAHYDMGKGLCVEHVGMGVRSYWNPKYNSADCAAMCAKLRISVLYEHDPCQFLSCFAHNSHDPVIEHYKDHNNDREAAWRYTACKVAEAIGRAMK